MKLAIRVKSPMPEVSHSGTSTQLLKPSVPSLKTTNSWSRYPERNDQVSLRCEAICLDIMLQCVPVQPGQRFSCRYHHYVHFDVHVITAGGCMTLNVLRYWLRSSWTFLHQQMFLCISNIIAYRYIYIYSFFCVISIRWTFVCYGILISSAYQTLILSPWEIICETVFFFQDNPPSYYHYFCYYYHPQK